MWDPNGPLPYFFVVIAHDPRLGIIHEGVHYKQLALSWANPNPVRRRYYDSTSNEGIAHYNESLMLQAGLFDDAPWSRLVVQNFKRLRSLRSVVDVSLATGAMTLEEGMRTFMDLVPIDYQTALEETAMYLASPGLAMSYMVGKLEVIRLLADAKRKLGDEFRLRVVPRLSVDQRQRTPLAAPLGDVGRPERHRRHRPRRLTANRPLPVARDR